MPAFVRSVKEVSQGYGSSINNGSIIGNVQAAGTFTMIIPATGATTPTGGTAFNTNGGPPPTRGRGRLRMSAVNAATTALINSVTVTDGTTTLQVYGPTVITVAGTVLDLTYEYNTDLNLTSTTVSITTAANTSTWDWEVSMTP